MPTLEEVTKQVRDSIWRQVHTTPAGRAILTKMSVELEQLVQNIVGNLVGGVVKNIVHECTGKEL